MLLDSATGTATLAVQAIATVAPTTGAKKTEDLPLARIFFAGTTTADDDCAYDITLWRPSDKQGASTGPQWMPTIIASGVFTLGTTVSPFAAANGLVADTITETTNLGCAVRSLANNGIAWLDVPLGNAQYIQVRIDRDGGSQTMTTADVLIQFGEDTGGMLGVSDLQIGAFEIKDATAATRANVATDGASSAKNALFVQDQPVLAKLTAGVPVTGTFWQTTQPVSAVAMPLPSGAATSANQTPLTSAPVEKTPVKLTAVTVATASTKVVLIGSETFARVLHLQAKLVAADNTGNIFIGLSDLDQGVAEMFELAPGEVFDLEMPAGTKIDLNDIYIDADSGSNVAGVVGWYIPV